MSDAPIVIIMMVVFSALQGFYSCLQFINVHNHIDTLKEEIKKLRGVE